MRQTYDAIVVGAGHNGLVNASYLAKAGKKTLLLEQNEVVGGAAITEELLPGFHFTTFSYAISLLRPDIVQDLNLVQHGLMILPMPRTFQPGYDGNYLLLGSDAENNYHEIARTPSKMQRVTGNSAFASSKCVTRCIRSWTPFRRTFKARIPRRSPQSRR